MSRSTLTIVVFVTLAAVSTLPCYAHDENLHAELSRAAFLSSDAFRVYLITHFRGPGTLLNAGQASPTAITSKTPEQWLQEGSYQEDMQDPPIFGGKHFLRSVDHFYTVVPNRQAGVAIGLTDSSESLSQLPA